MPFSGLVVSIILLPSALTGILAGRVSDKISRKYTIAMGCAIFAVGTSIGEPEVRTTGEVVIEPVADGWVVVALSSLCCAQLGDAVDRTVHCREWRGLLPQCCDCLPV